MRRDLVEAAAQRRPRGFRSPRDLRRRSPVRGRSPDPPVDRTSRRTRCRKRSFARGNSFPHCATRIGSTPGSIAWWSTPVQTRADSCGDGRGRCDRSRSSPPSATTPVPSPIGNSWSVGFSRLKPEQRAVVVLHYYSGFSAAEIARMLGIPEGTARSRLHYATEAMRAALESDARQPAVAQNRTA